MTNKHPQYMQQRSHDPSIDFLRPGEYADRVVERIDLPGPHGAVPGLRITPKQPSDTIIAVLHGSGSDKYVFSWDLVDTLITAGVAVALLDLDGHGESPRPQRFPGILESMRGALNALHDGYTRIGVLGVSLGGCIAAHAYADGLMLDGLAIVGSPQELMLTPHTRRLEALRLLNRTTLRLLRRMTIGAMVRIWTRTPPIRWEIDTFSLIAALDLCGSLRRIAAERPRIPFMAIYGTHDAISPPAQARLVAAALPGWAQFETVPRASHLSLLNDLRALRLISAWARAINKPNQEAKRATIMPGSVDTLMM